MRRIGNLSRPKDGTIRLMIYSDTSGTYLFGYGNSEDSGASWDQWFESENDALEYSEAEYDMKANNWTEIPNPDPNCQHDWINPVRIKGRENGNPEFGKLEKKIDGKWIEI